MRIAVTGRNGQVARALAERAADGGIEVVSLARPQLDLIDSSTIKPALDAARPDMVVNAAAYTMVDQAESEPDLAMSINCDGARAVAAAAHTLGIPIIHLSTDYVFDGRKSLAYTETDGTRPTGVYGRTKLAGEHAVAQANARHVILRTAWVHAPYGKNFVRTMLRLAETRSEIGVVDDQLGAPTYAPDVAEAIIAVARNLHMRDKDDALFGTFHLTSAGVASWAEVAETIFETSGSLRGPTSVVRRIGSENYPTPAQRPPNSRLDCTKISNVHHVRLPEWRTSLQACVVQILNAKAGT